jgi:VanZ family protein
MRNRLETAAAPLRWLAALAYSAFMTLVLVQSSGSPVIGPPAPPGMPSLGREIILLAGHVIAFSVLTVGWYWAYRATLPPRPALRLAVMIGLGLGLATELAQMPVPDRGASVFDVAANWLATLLTAYAIRRQGMRAR